MSKPGEASAAHSPTLVEAVGSFLAAGGWKRPLLALSGGPDSVCLLLALIEVAQARRMEVAACHVDHGLRPSGELAAERVFVSGLCSARGVPLAIARAERGEIEARATDAGGVEAAARAFRYAALESARLEGGHDVTLTAHTQDDFIETMVMRFFTGSGAAGLRGIPESNGPIARPLLSVTKASVLAFLAERGQGYSVDSTNGTDAFLRNRVRAEAMPALRKTFPNLASSLFTVARKMADDEAAIEAMAAAAIGLRDGDAGPEGGRACVASAKAFAAAPKAVRLRIVYRLVGSLAPGRFPGGLASEAADWDGMSARLASGAGIEIVAEGGLVFARRAPAPFLGLDQPESAGFSVLLDGPGEARIGMDRLVEVYSAGPGSGRGSVALSWPVRARSKRPGDSIRTVGGSLSVDELLREWKIDPARRNAVPLIEDRDGVAAVLGAAMGGKDVFRRGSSPDADRHFSFDSKGAVPPDVARR